MSVRLGINPIAWSNDDLRELGGETPLETCLSEARAAGFTGIELGHKFPSEPDALRAVLGRHDLALVSGWYSTNLLERDAADELAAMRRHLDLLRACGCSVAIVAETSLAIHGDRNVPLSQRPVLPAADWPLFTRRMTDLAEAVRAEGISLAYHHHMGTVVQTEDEIDRLMALTSSSLTLLLDTGHATFANADPVALARRYRGRISHVHCKDVRPAAMVQPDRSFLDSVIAGVFTVPGDGCVDFAAVLAELRGYEGWLVVEAEQDPARAHPLTYARMGYDHLSAAARQAGFVIT